MVRAILSIVILAAVMALPAASQAKHRLWSPKAAQTAPWAGDDRLMLVQQRRQNVQSRHRAPESDQNRARDAVGAGDVLPLQQIMRRVGRRYPGRLLDADLGQDRQGRWLYRLKLLAPGDQVQRLVVDAQSGQVLQSSRRR